jgi:uncharacterized protein YheU (UPF0270 family)
MEDLIIDTPMCEVWREGVCYGKINEYTFRNIQLQVKKNNVKNDFVFVFNNISTALNTNGKSINKKFGKGFLDLAYNLAFAMMD